ncbi:MAG: polyisoprenoid-binding protein YceI [Myxococcota bacterium]|jgi:polyisoprenoid-binding protein YceI
MTRWMPAITLATLAMSPAAAHAGDYNLSGTLYIQVFKDPDTLGAGLSHDHVMVAKGWSGSASYDAAAPGSCNISVTVPVSSLDVDPDYMRQAVGYDTMLTADQRADVKKNMLAATQLNAAAHPNITFQSTSCTATAISGNLTIRGTSRPVTLTAQIAEDGTSFSAKGQVGIRATQFGFEPYSALFGQLKNRDDMKLTVKFQSQ